MKYSRRQLLQLAAAASFMPRFTSSAADRAKMNMIVRSIRPEDLEMPLDGFRMAITPIERFYVRTHVYVPKVNPATWKLTVDGEVNSPLALTLDDLKKLPRVDLVAVLECAGNGRAFYTPHLPGVQWQYGAVGCAKWTGVRLADVLKRAGIKASAKQLLMDGADVPLGKMADFQRTIDVEKGLHPDTLLAFEMNGEALPASHGFPLRLIVPGWAGDSWMKWVQGIHVLSGEFDGWWMKNAYRYPVRLGAPGAPVDPSLTRPLTSIHVKSVIAAPLDKAKLPLGGPVSVTGMAWSGESGPVTGVDVSVDGGRNWKAANLVGSSTRYGFRQFEYSWTPEQAGYYNVMARATDTGGDKQPFTEEWNPSGYQWNVVHSAGIDMVERLNEVAPAQANQPAATTATGDVPKDYGNTCLTCHEEDIVRAQRLTKAQWDRELNKMSGWGAPVTPDNRSGILDYLVKNFGPDSAR